MPHRNGRIWIGVIFIIFGAMLFIDNLHFFDITLRHVFFSFPMFLIIIGIIILANSRNRLAGYIILGIGILWLLPRITPFHFRLYFSDLWPLIIILVGLMILLKRRDHAQLNNAKPADDGTFHSPFDFSADLLDETAILYHSRKIVTSQNFRGGKITAFMGHSDIDFSQAKLAPDQNRLDLSIFMGAVELHVPANWKVVINVTTVFGGFDEKRYFTSPPPEISEGTLVVTGFILFGGGKIENSYI